MVAAAAGLLPPAAGAVLQEVIDVARHRHRADGAAARRACTPSRCPRRTSPPRAGCARSTTPCGRLVEQVRTVADGLSSHHGDLGPVRALLDRLEAELLPHERAEEELLVPIVARALGGTDADRGAQPHPRRDRAPGRPAAPAAAANSTRRAPAAEDVIELRRLLYGLYAILRLHNAQEEEDAFSLVPGGAANHPG